MFDVCDMFKLDAHCSRVLGRLCGAKSAAAARRLRADLEANPPNAAARFFDFNVDTVGLKVTVL